MRRTALRSAVSGLAAMFACVPAAAVTCAITPQGVNFGSYGPLNPQPLDSAGNISVQCDGETTFTLSLDRGAGSYSARQMSSGANVLEYNLYTDPSRVIVWGDGSAGTDTVSATATAAEKPIYGRITPRQNVPVGSYADVITVTLTY
jgi:spore coat protein U-like protein